MKSIGDRLVDTVLAILMVSLILAVLVVLVATALIAGGIGFLVWRQISRHRDEAARGPKTSLFGAPASNWWVETYERWLWRLENLTGANFTSSPERLFVGSFFLASLTGLPLAALPLPVWVPLLVIVANGLSAWVLSKPAANWWQPSLPEVEQGAWEAGGFILGTPLDDLSSED